MYLESMTTLPSIGDRVECRVDSHGFAFDMYPGRAFSVMGHYVEPCSSLEYRRNGTSPVRQAYRVHSVGGQRVTFCSRFGDDVITFAVNVKPFGLELAFWEVVKARF